MSKKPKADAVVVVMPFNASVALFEDRNELIRYHSERLGIELDLKPSGYGSAHENEDAKGVVWWSMYIPKKANLPTIVHECSHIVDFMMDTHGVPINMENTEIRAYMLGYLFQDVCEALGRSLDAD